MWAQSGHDQVGWEVEDNIANVEKGQTGGDLVRRAVEDRAQIVAGIGVHGLRETDIGAHSGAEEVEDPERGNDSVVQFSTQVRRNLDARRKGTNL